jgi:hypothetical protein
VLLEALQEAGPPLYTQFGHLLLLQVRCTASAHAIAKQGLSVFLQVLFTASLNLGLVVKAVLHWQCSSQFCKQGPSVFLQTTWAHVHPRCP